MKGAARIESLQILNPVPVSQLAPAEPPAWVWPGYVARGCSTLLTGLPKSGKTTLLSRLVRDIGAGDGLAEGCPPAKTLVLSEEPPSLWARRRDELGLTDHLSLCCRPLRGKPTREKWEQITLELAERVRTDGLDLVVIDTLPAFWSVLDENSASEVTDATLPLHAVTAAGAGLLLLHHPRKSGGTEGTAARGSGALPGAVDVVLELRRYAPEDPADARRKLTAFSRFDETPDETILELTANGYVVLGDGADVKKRDRVEAVRRLLPTDQPGLTVDEVLERWPSEPKPGKRTLAGDLDAGVRAGHWVRRGSGTKGNAHRYDLGVGFDSGKPLP